MMHPHSKDQPLMAAEFNRAAESYDQHAELQRTVAGRLLERLSLMKIEPEFILDLGSGTGGAAQTLLKHYPKASVFELDLAINMLRTSRPRWPWQRARRGWVCGDSEQLPVSSSSVDLVYSSLMLQWCNEPAVVLGEACRVLRPGGLLLFSTLGPDTLGELRNSWAAADDLVHVNAFSDMHDVGDALVQRGLADPVMETDRITVTYADGYALMRDLKRLGAHNVNAGRRRTLTGKGRIKRMLEAYERTRSNGRLPATYEVVYGHAWRTEHALRIDEHTAHFPIAALKRRRP